MFLNTNTLEAFEYNYKYYEMQMNLNTNSFKCIEIQILFAIQHIAHNNKSYQKYCLFCLLQRINERLQHQVLSELNEL